MVPDWWEPGFYRHAIEKEVQRWLDKYVLINQEKKTITGNGNKERYYLYNCKYISLINTDSIVKIVQLFGVKVAIVLPQLTVNYQLVRPLIFNIISMEVPLSTHLMNLLYGPMMNLLCGLV